MSKEQVEQARYYSRLNLTIAEVTGDAKSDKLVTAQWRIAMKYAAGNKTDSIAVNRAKDCLEDNESRMNYNASIQAAGSSDGQSKDPNWEETLKNKGKPGIIEVK